MSIAAQKFCNVIIDISLCRFIYPGLEITCTVLCRPTLNADDNEVQLTRAFANVCHLHQLRRPSDVFRGIVRDGGGKDTWMTRSQY